MVSRRIDAFLLDRPRDKTHPKAPSHARPEGGLPPEAETACDQLCLIPMRGGADSLNLAQATAIMTYEAWRQRDFK